MVELKKKGNEKKNILHFEKKLGKEGKYFRKEIILVKKKRIKKHWVINISIYWYVTCTLNNMNT